MDCDRFFDEVADANQKFLEKESQERKRKKTSGMRQIAGVEVAHDLTLDEADFEAQAMIGLSKTVFFKYLSNYGVILKE